MKKVVLISASPRPEARATSSFLSNMQADIIGGDNIDVCNINVRSSIVKNRVEDDFEEMLMADAFIITFPLYVFCLPGMLMRFLQDYYAYWLKNKDRCSTPKKVYSVINCGFPEPDINEEAARVIKSFSQKIESTYGFSLLIGSGGMLAGTQGAPFMKKTFGQITDAFKQMACDIVSSDDRETENISVWVNFPKKIYLYSATKHWLKQGKQNGLKKKDLYRRPYLDE